MSIDFRCDGCGQTLRAGDQFQGQTMQCPACRASTVVPVKLLFAEGVTGSRPGPPPLGALAPGQVIATAPHCPSCGTALAADAVLCVECGFDRRTGKRQKTKKRRLKRRFDVTMPLASRIAAAATVVLIPFLYMHRAGTFLWFLVPPCLLLAIAFVIPHGFMSRITVRRGRHGDLWLKREHWVCFLPLGNWTVNLHGYTEAWTDYAEYVDRNHNLHERHMLEITGPERQTRVIYDGPDDDLMRDLADVLQYDAGLKMRRK
jgi:hypothetical protein